METRSGHTSNMRKDSGATPVGDALATIMAPPRGAAAAAPAAPPRGDGAGVSAAPAPSVATHADPQSAVVSAVRDAVGSAMRDMVSAVRDAVGSALQDPLARQTAAIEALRADIAALVGALRDRTEHAVAPRRDAEAAPAPAPALSPVPQPALSVDPGGSLPRSGAADGDGSHSGAAPAGERCSNTSRDPGRDDSADRGTATLRNPVVADGIGTPTTDDVLAHAEYRLAAAAQRERDVAARGRAVPVTLPAAAAVREDVGLLGLQIVHSAGTGAVGTAADDEPERLPSITTLLTQLADHGRFVQFLPAGVSDAVGTSRGEVQVVDLPSLRRVDPAACLEFLQALRATLVRACDEGRYVPRLRAMFATGSQAEAHMQLRMARDCSLLSRVVSTDADTTTLHRERTAVRDAVLRVLQHVTMLACPWLASSAATRSHLALHAFRVEAPHDDDGAVQAPRVSQWLLQHVRDLFDVITAGNTFAEPPDGADMMIATLPAALQTFIATQLQLLHGRPVLSVHDTSGAAPLLFDARRASHMLFAVEAMTAAPLAVSAALMELAVVRTAESRVRVFRCRGLRGAMAMYRGGALVAADLYRTPRERSRTPGSNASLSRDWSHSPPRAPYGRHREGRDRDGRDRPRSRSGGGARSVTWDAQHHREERTDTYSDRRDGTRTYDKSSRDDGTYHRREAPYRHAAGDGTRTSDALQTRGREDVTRERAHDAHARPARSDHRDWRGHDRSASDSTHPSGRSGQSGGASPHGSGRAPERPAMERRREQPAARVHYMDGEGARTATPPAVARGGDAALMLKSPPNAVTARRNPKPALMPTSPRENSHNAMDDVVATTWDNSDESASDAATSEELSPLWRRKPPDTT